MQNQPQPTAKGNIVFITTTIQSHTNTPGFIGFVLSLEGGLVDTTELQFYALAYLAKVFQLPEENRVPNAVISQDLIGCEFKDILLGLGWNIAKEQMQEVGSRLSSWRKAFRSLSPYAFLSLHPRYNFSPRYTPGRQRRYITRE